MIMTVRIGRDLYELDGDFVWQSENGLGEILDALNEHTQVALDLYSGPQDGPMYASVELVASGVAAIWGESFKMVESADRLAMPCRS